MHTKVKYSGKSVATVTVTKSETFIKAERAVGVLRILQAQQKLKLLSNIPTTQCIRRSTRELSIISLLMKKNAVPVKYEKHVSVFVISEIEALKS